MSELTNILDTVWDGQLSCYDAEAITIGGTEYACESGELTLGNTLIPGGEWDTNTVQVAVKRSLLSALPALNTTATLKSIAYRIDKIRDEPDQGVVIFELLPAHT